MTYLKPQETRSPLLSLPTEVRLHIYSYILPPPTGLLPIDLCTSDDNKNVVPTRKPSPLSTLLSQTLRLTTLTRTSGLHLLEVSRLTHSETHPLFQRITPRFHCARCYEEFLRHQSLSPSSVSRTKHTAGKPGLSWIRQVEIEFDLHDPRSSFPWFSAATDPRDPRHRLTERFARQEIDRGTRRVREVAWRFWGRTDLLESDRDGGHDEGGGTWQTWEVKKLDPYEERQETKTRKRKRKRIRRSQEEEQAGEIENENEDRDVALWTRDGTEHKYRLWLICGRFDHSNLT